MAVWLSSFYLLVSKCWGVCGAGVCCGTRAPLWVWLLVQVHRVCDVLGGMSRGIARYCKLRDLLCLLTDFAASNCVHALWLLCCAVGSVAHSCFSALMLLVLDAR